MDGKSLRSLNESVSRIIREDEHKGSQQRKIGTYQTKFFHLCPGAQQIFPEIEEEIGGKDAAPLAKMADDIFKIEDQVLKAGEPNEQASSAAREIYGEMMDMARKLGVDEKLDFMKGHLEIIDRGSKTEEDEKKPGMRGFAGDMGGALDGGMVDGGGAMGEALDPVGKEDNDIDNDGDTDDTDKYLINRRKAIKKAIGNKRGKKAKKNVNERKYEILGSLLSEEEGDEEDMEKVVDELKGASKMHLGQAKRLTKYLNKKKVNEDMDRFYIQQRDKRFTSEVDKDDPSKITSASPTTAGARRFTQDQADAIVKRGTDYDVRTPVKADPDANADFGQHLSDQGVLLAKDHYKHGIHHKELFDDERTNSYAFMSTMHSGGISDPHTFHDLENKGVSAVGFLPKGGVNLDPQKVRAERMMTSEHEGLIKKHDIRDIDAKHRYGYKAESYTRKDLREATMDRIKKLSSQARTDTDNTILQRIRRNK